MDRKQDRSNPDSSRIEGSGAPSKERRLFLKAGIVAAPVILTLKARPLWGQEENPKGKDKNKNRNLTMHSLTHLSHGQFPGR